MNNIDLIDHLRTKLQRLDALELHYANGGKCVSCGRQDVLVESPKCKNCEHATALAIIDEGTHVLGCGKCGCTFVMDEGVTQGRCLECEGDDTLMFIELEGIDKIKCTRVHAKYRGYGKTAEEAKQMLLVKEKLAEEARQ